ncbi:MAG: methyltransferase domain-containing protein, partial [Microcoleus sp. SIO2G3]|nr:methyltransferase domain-containing protein [Microcoleus sp. SIO2G3]
DLAQPAPPFVSLLDSPDAPKPGRMIVLGMGRGHDALLFGDRGFSVTGVDFAPSAIEAATAAAQSRGLKAEFLQRDIFDLLPEFAGQFDYVLEHTCFCAIALEQRPAYVNLVRSLLHRDGELIALFWAHDRSGGPPFGTSTAELHQLFGSAFDISLESVANSIAARQNEEYLGRLRVRSESTDN